ncbi:MAG: hypothetical protein EU541_00655 [Promethearchaeota archaeon]|nr:MAG: hypothetical protein EU541_00655 [Candidatus Lokiarchaeota archaeon]
MLLKEKNYYVHAWICNLYRIKGKIADFTNASEREAQKDWTLALLNEYKQLDGIHFDYIRYENLSLVNYTKMNAIQKTISLTKNAIRIHFPDKTLSTASFPLSGEIRESQDEVPSWFDVWTDNPENNAINRWNRSGYNFSGIPTPFRVQQDPKEWIIKNITDFTVSMEYCYNTNWWKGEVDIWNNWLRSNISNVFMGLGYYSRVWEDPEISPSDVANEIAEKIKYGRAHNISGFSIFELGEPGNDDYILINALTKGPNAPFKDISNNSPILEDFFSLIFVISFIGVVLFVVLAFTYFYTKKRKK